MPLFYGRRDGALVAGSTPSLVALALGRDPEAVDLAQPLRHHTGINYLPAPGTRYLGIRRLLRDQRLNLAADRIERHPAPIVPLASYAAAVETLAGELAASPGSSGRRPGHGLRPADRGPDSRTIVAAFVAEGIAFETVTLRSKAKPEDDITVARRISRQLGVRHHVIDLETPPDPAAGAAYRLQTGGGTNGWDLTDLFPGNAYRFLAAGDVMVGGACFGSAARSCRRFDGLTLATAPAPSSGGGSPGRQDRRSLARLPRRLARLAAADPYPLDCRDQLTSTSASATWIATSRRASTCCRLTPASGEQPAIYAALLTPDARERRRPAAARRDRAHSPRAAGTPVNPVPLGRRVPAGLASPRCGAAIRSRRAPARLRPRRGRPPWRGTCGWCRAARRRCPGRSAGRARA